MQLTIIPSVNNENPDLCNDCGKCCKSYPGGTIPSDFDEKDLEGSVLEAIKSGRYTIDWWEGTPDRTLFKGYITMYVRPAMKRHEHEVRDASWGGGECTFLGANGCELPFDNRPYACRDLKPGRKNGDIDCKHSWEVDHPGRNDKWFCCIQWIPYQDLLNRVAERLESN
jgi:Fe-S-cluster containining protein